MRNVWLRAEELAWADCEAYRRAISIARHDSNYSACDILVMWRRAQRFRRAALRIGARLNAQASSGYSLVVRS